MDGVKTCALSLDTVHLLALCSPERTANRRRRDGRGSGENGGNGPGGAGEIRASHYHRKTAALSLADCVLLAAAGPEDEIATSDRAVAVAAHHLGIGLIPLLDSQGERPRVE